MLNNPYIPLCQITRGCCKSDPSSPIKPSRLCFQAELFSTLLAICQMCAEIFSCSREMFSGIGWLGSS